MDFCFCVDWERFSVMIGEISAGNILRRDRTVVWSFPFAERSKGDEKKMTRNWQNYPYFRSNILSIIFRVELTFIYFHHGFLVTIYYAKIWKCKEDFPWNVFEDNLTKYMNIYRGFWKEDYCSTQDESIIIYN